MIRPKTFLPPESRPRLLRFLKERRTTLQRLARDTAQNYTHLSEVFAGKRAISEKAFLTIADALDMDPKVLSIRIGLPVDEGESPPAPEQTPVVLYQRAIAAQNSGDFAEAVHLGRHGYQIVHGSGDRHAAARWASLVAVCYRHLGEYDNALRYLRFAETDYDSAISAESNPSHGLLLNQCRNDLFTIWISSHTLTAEWPKAARDYRALLRRVAKIEENSDDEVKWDCEVERAGIRRRLLEVNYLCGRYRRSLEGFSQMRKKGIDPFSDEHALWVHLGVARADFMLGESQCLLSLKKIVWGGKRLRKHRVEQYAQGTILKFHLSRGEFATFDTIYKAQPVHQSRRQKIHRLVLLAARILADGNGWDAARFLQEAAAEAEGDVHSLALIHERNLVTLLQAIDLRIREDATALPLARRAFEGFICQDCSWGILRSWALIRHIAPQEAPSLPNLRFEGVDLRLHDEMRSGPGRPQDLIRFIL
jgi:tetratricopeptide (TPR) repeat protein